MSDNGNAKTIYLHIPGTKPRVVTLVHTLEKTDTGKSYARVGYAICNQEVDQFNKKIGRKISTGRLESVRTAFMITYPEDANNWHKRMNYMLNALVIDEQAPKRLSSAVEKYILKRESEKRC